MKKKEAEKRKLERSNAFPKGLLIAALAFSAGVAGAWSYRSVERGRVVAVRVEAASPVTASGGEVASPVTASKEANRSIVPSDQGGTEPRLEGHSELVLQLD